MKKLTKKELNQIKVSYHIGDNRYARCVCVEKLVGEIERLWDKESSGRKMETKLRAEERKQIKKWKEEDKLNFGRQ